MKTETTNEALMNKEQSRRAFLRGVASSALPLAYVMGVVPALAQSSGQQPNAQQPTLIVRVKEPENLEFPFATLDSFITPNERFYVRNHFLAPPLEGRAWRLKVEGAVARPLELSLAELLQLPARTQVAVLECAGNNRALLTPTVKGVQWELGAVGNAAWTGLPLSTLLERAGVKSGAVEVILEGADAGEIKDPPKPSGPIHFARSLPLEKALKSEVLLAYKMNGAELPAAHGYPLRAVVPGWYGVASVKWLTRIIVTDRPFDGFYQSVDYAYWQRRDGLPTRVPLTEMEVKGAMARPALREVVAANTTYRMHGAAWSGESEVTKVEVSADEGRTWAMARLLDPSARHTWRRWEYEWRTPARPGSQKVMARATDTRGRTQPMERDRDRENYMISHVLPIEIEVR